MLHRRRRRGGAAPLLLAGLAAFAYYKYSKMSEEERRNLIGGLKEKGKRLYDQYVPEKIKRMFGKNDNTASNRQSENQV